MSSPANPSTRASADLTGYIAFFLALLITTSSPAAAVDPKRCEHAKKAEETAKAVCEWSWSVCFSLDEKGNQISKDCTANDLRALAVNCREVTAASQHRQTVCGK